MESPLVPTGGIQLIFFNQVANGRLQFIVLAI